METLFQAVELLRGHPWAPFAFVGAYALACLAAPISLFPLAGSVLFGFWGGLLCNAAGALGGATLGFFLSRSLGRNALRRLTGPWWDRFERASDTHFGFASLVTIRLVGFPPFQLVNYLAGLSTMRPGAYLAATFLGMFPWTVLLTYFGHLFWNILRTSGMVGFRQALAAHSRPLLGGALLFAMVMWLVTRVRERRAAEDVSRGGGG